jgi:hypothetical protein
VDWNKVDFDSISFEQNRRPADHKLADPTAAEATANRNSLSVLPFLHFQKAMNNLRKSVREILDCPLNDARGLRFSLRKQRIEIRPTEFVAFFISEWVVARFTQGLSNLLDHVAESAFAGAIAYETSIVLDLEVVAVDKHRREPIRSVSRNGR